MVAEPGPELDVAAGRRTVVAAFVSMAVVFGVAYSFGAFFVPMAAEFGTGSGATSVVFAVTAFCWFVLSPVTGRIADRRGPRPVLLAGATALATGLVLTAAVRQLWLGYLTYGAGVGIAVACGYVPLVAAVGGWFVRRRAIALAIAVAGIGVGTLLGAPLAAVLIASVVGRIALQPAVIADAFGVSGLGWLVGLVYTAAGIGALLGAPLAGVLVDVTGGYGWAAATAGVCGLGAFAVLLPLGRADFVRGSGEL